MNETELKALLKYRSEEVYAGAQSAWKKANDYYEQKDEIPVPKALEAVGVHMNTARKIVDTGDHNYMKDNPVTEIRPAGRSQKDEDKARNTQLVMDACLKEMVMPIVKNAPKKLLLRGVVMLGLWFNPDYYTTKELTKEEKEGIADRALFDFPLKFTCYDPMHCYPSRAMQNNFQPVDMLVAYDMLSQEAEAMATNNHWDWKPDENQKEVKFYDYYTNEHRTIMLGEKIVYDDENALGFVPFIIIPAGFGQSSPKIEEEWRPIYFAEEELMTYTQTCLSAQIGILLKKAWPQTEVIAEAEVAAAEFPNGIPTSPDVPLVHSQNVTVQDKVTKGPDNSWMQEIAVLQGLIDVPAELGGGQTSGVYSARHAEALMTHQRAKYKDALMNLQRGLEFYLKMCSKALKKLGNAVSVYAMDSGKAVVREVALDTIDERCEVKVKLISESPEAQMALRSQGIAEMQARTIDLQTHHTQFCGYSIEESQRIQDAIIMDDYMQQPFMKSLVTAIIAKEKGDVLTAQLAMAQFVAERGGANNVTAKTGTEMVPQSGELPEGASTPYEQKVAQQ
jgi:hypothetical protein